MSFPDSIGESSNAIHIWIIRSSRIMTNNNTMTSRAAKSSPLYYNITIDIWSEGRRFSDIIF